MTEDELLLLDRIGPALLNVKHLDEELRSMMLPGAPRGGEGGGGKPGSKPPVSTHLLDLVVDAWTITRSWAGYLFVETWGSQIAGTDAREWMQQRHSTAQGYCDWLYQYRELIVARSWAQDILDELEDLQGQMRDALPRAEPEPIREVPASARGMLVTAAHASKLTRIPAGTISRWGSTGAIPSTGKPRRYKVGDILDHYNRPARTS